MMLSKPRCVFCNYCLTLLLVLAATGCQLHKPEKSIEYKTVAVDPHRDTQAARRHNASAVALLGKNKLDEAEKELKAALGADTFFGPAHNNLGTIYHRQEKFYLAAWEFQYAIKLMPNRAQPRNNLGMVFEAVGKLDDAAKSYEEALEIEPDTPEIVGNLARIYVRKNRHDARTRQLLEDIVLKDTRPRWSAWARQRLATIPKPATPTTEPVQEQ